MEASLMQAQYDSKKVHIGWKITLKWWTDQIKKDKTQNFWLLDRTRAPQKIGLYLSKQLETLSDDKWLTKQLTPQNFNIRNSLD